MKKIEGSPKSLKQLLQNTKYSIHYYQREYMWQRKHIEELIDDLTSEFLDYYVFYGICYCNVRRGISWYSFFKETYYTLFNWNCCIYNIV